MLIESRNSNANLKERNITRNTIAKKLTFANLKHCLKKELDFQNSITKPEFDFGKKTTNFCKTNAQRFALAVAAGRARHLR